MAQQGGTVHLPNAEDSDEIIVEALRLPRRALPTQVRWSYVRATHNRIQYERAREFAKCARETGSAWLRKVVDGEPNSAQATFAQGWIVLKNRVCYPGFPSQSAAPDVADFGRSSLDRAALLEEVFKTHAPDAALTIADTHDPEVRERFRNREIPRNRLRIGGDREALVLTSCLVREQPELATRLIRSAPGSALGQGLTQAMLVEGRACLGENRKIVIDPTNFRAYVLDAFYRWVVAARNVASLIPAA
ncbi:hypothetical protein ASG07_13265 [Sphingomonas sp. Leaf343]|nr:hypothetical protein ASG07_13265 [Sphingomonas sp. Leaf343]